MLKIRLKRIGRKGYPSYRIVVMKALSRRDGKAIAELGFYNPISKEVKINIDRTRYFLKSGVQPTPTVRSLLLRSNVFEAK
mgnify:CR=1 FL=1